MKFIFVTVYKQNLLLNGGVAKMTLYSCKLIVLYQIILLSRGINFSCYAVLQININGVEFKLYKQFLGIFV